MYFNTTNEQGQELREARSKTIIQQDRIVNFLKINPKHDFTPCEVHKALFDSNTPLTSIRRAMTTATGQGLIVQTGNKRKGIYGKDNFCWRY
jgi:hypothetical protein